MGVPQIRWLMVIFSISIFYFGRLYSPFSDIHMLIPSGDAFHGGYEPFKVR